jgi:hypothetical protein
VGGRDKGKKKKLPFPCCTSGEEEEETLPPQNGTVSSLFFFFSTHETASLWRQTASQSFNLRAFFILVLGLGFLQLSP